MHHANKKRVLGKEDSAINIDVIFLKSESSQKLQSEMKTIDSENIKPERLNDTNQKDIVIVQKLNEQHSNDLCCIIEEEEAISEQNKIEKNSDVYYSLDHSDRDVDEKEVEENEIFLSVCSTINLIDNTDEDDDFDNHLLVEKNELSDKQNHSDSFSNILVDREVHYNKEDKHQPFYSIKFVKLEFHSATLKMFQEMENEEEIGPNICYDISMVDILIVVYRDNDELEKVLYHTGGVIEYVRKYWVGFFPLLLIHLSDTRVCEPPNESNLSFLETQFSCIHRVIIRDIINDSSFLLESIVQYYLHVHYLQCGHLPLVRSSSLNHRLSSGQWSCPGLCELHTLNNKTGGDREDKKRSLLQSVKRRFTVRKDRIRRSRSQSRKLWE